MNHESGYPVLCNNLYREGGEEPVTAEVCSRHVHLFFSEESIACAGCGHQTACRIAKQGPEHDAD